MNVFSQYVKGYLNLRFRNGVKVTECGVGPTTIFMIRIQKPKRIFAHIIAINLGKAQQLGTL